VKPVVPEVKPVVPEVKPVVPEVKPVEVNPVVSAVAEVKPEVKPATPPTVFDLQLQKALGLADNGEYLGAREMLEQLMGGPGIVLFDPQWQAASEKLNALNTVFVRTDLRCPEKVAYTVKDGDVLIKIAYRNGTTVEQLTKNNPALQKPRAVIHPGQNIYILKGDWKLIVYRSQYRMLVYNGNKLFKIYRIAIGKEGRTPQGSFLIDDKVKEPPFRDIPYSGDANGGNPLGTRWMRLKPIEGTPADLAGYGIHGTWNNDSLGKPASNGCLRMANSDVEELFDLLPMKAETVRVEIKE
jgi:lipoprotein-anchoring transpeptidase ErfK/SrfK